MPSPDDYGRDAAYRRTIPRNFEDLKDAAYRRAMDANMPHRQAIYYAELKASAESFPAGSPDRDFFDRQARQAAAGYDLPA